jgi:hypothetical protein
MVKITELKGEKGFFKKVYAENYYGTFDFKLKFAEENKNCEIKQNTMVYCDTDQMTIEVWIDEPNIKDYNFCVETVKIERL